MHWQLCGVGGGVLNNPYIMKPQEWLRENEFAYLKNALVLVFSRIFVFILILKVSTLGVVFFQFGPVHPTNWGVLDVQNPHPSQIYYS